MDEGAAVFDAAAESFFAGLVVAGTVEDNFRSEGARGGHLDLRRGEGHYDLRADAAGGGVESEALGMVAGAGGDDAFVAFDFVEGKQLVEGAALFEGSGSLEIVELEVKRQAGELREMMRELAGRDMDCVADAGAGCLDSDETYGIQLRFSLARMEEDR
jgi:hypothetical protein